MTDPQRPSPFELDRSAPKHRRQTGDEQRQPDRLDLRRAACGSRCSRRAGSCRRLHRSNGQPADLETVRNAVLAALEEAGHRMAADSLEKGEWAVKANGLTVKVSSGEQMIAMTFGPEQRHLIQQAVKPSPGVRCGSRLHPGGAKERRAAGGVARQSLREACAPRRRNIRWCGE